MATSQRRRPGEARAAIIEAARERFSAGGYQGTTIRDIAQHAKVNEVLIFRHFRTKEQLFQEAVVAPFQEFVGELLQRWHERAIPPSNADLVAMFVGEMHDFALEHRDVVFAIVNAERFAQGAQPPAGLAMSLSSEIARIAAASTAEAHVRDIAHTDFSVVVPCVVAMILGVVIFDDWLFPQGENHPSDTDVRRWMVAQAMGALAKPV
jgi:AcrR family transcriptional regulator